MKRRQIKFILLYGGVAYILVVAGFYFQEVIGREFRTTSAAIQKIETENQRIRATFLLQKANAGDMVAQENVAALYAQGNGLPQDYSKSYFWLLVATRSGGTKAAEMSKDIEPYLSQHVIEAEQARALAWKPTP